MSKLLLLPKFRAKLSAFSSEYLATDMLEAYSWNQRLIRASTAMLTPVLYHRGTWLASQGYDPGLEVIPGEFPYKSGITPVIQQYGNPWSETGRLIRTPTVILFNGFLSPTNQSFSAIQDSFNVIERISDRLEYVNALVASIYNEGTRFIKCFLPVQTDEFVGGNLLVLSGLDLSSPSNSEPYIQAAPPQSVNLTLDGQYSHDVTAYITMTGTIHGEIHNNYATGGLYTYYGNHIDGGMIVADPYPQTLTPSPGTTSFSSFIPGFTSSLTGVSVQNPVAHNLPQWIGFHPTETVGPYPYEYPPPPGVTNQPKIYTLAFALEANTNVATVDFNSGIFSADLDVLEAALPRFRNLRHICYGRAAPNGQPEVSTIYSSMRQRAVGLNTELRGPYPFDTDLTSMIQNDIIEWLETL